MTAIDVYGNKDKLGKRVVVIGGSEIGMETAMYLAENGHNVTILTRQNKFAAEADRVHYYSMFVDTWKKMVNLTPIKKAETSRIDGNVVSYVDADGVEHVIEATALLSLAA